MRIAVLGSGRMGRFRASVLSHHPLVEWVGIGSSSCERAEAAARDVGARGWGTREEVLEPAPDAVVVATATADHARLVSGCIELGVPILCEKPLAMTLEESETLVADATRAGVTLQMGFQRRHDAGFRAARERVASGALGAIYLLTLASHDREPPAKRFAVTSGGMFRDLHVHDFDLARWLLDDEVEEVFAVAGVRTGLDYLEELGDVDTTGIVLRMRRGVPVLIGGARHDPAGHDVRGEIFGSRETLVMGLDERTPLTKAEDVNRASGANTYRDFLDRFEQAFVNETNAFVGVVSGARENPCPGTEVLEATRIAIAAERSHREHRVVRLHEAPPALVDA